LRLELGALDVELGVVRRGAIVEIVEPSGFDIDDFGDREIALAAGADRGEQIDDAWVGLVDRGAPRKAADMEPGLAAGAEEIGQIAVPAVARLQLGAFVVLRLEPGHRRNALFDQRGIAVGAFDHRADIEDIDTRRIEVENVLQEVHDRLAAARRVGRSVHAR